MAKDIPAIFLKLGLNEVEKSYFEAATNQIFYSNYIGYAEALLEHGRKYKTGQTIFLASDDLIVVFKKTVDFSASEWREVYRRDLRPASEKKTPPSAPKRQEPAIGKSAIIGIDYDEGNPASYRATVVSFHDGTKETELRFTSRKLVKDLTEALDAVRAAGYRFNDDRTAIYFSSTYDAYFNDGGRMSDDWSKPERSEVGILPNPKRFFGIF